MSFEKWFEENIKWMAEEFAVCDDAKAIEDILWQLYGIWKDETAHRISSVARVEQVRKLFSRIGDK